MLDSYREKRDFPQDARASARRTEAAGAQPHVRRAAARRAANALRRPPRNRRRLEVVARAQGPVARPGREAARRHDGGPPAGVRVLRGRNPERRVRRGPDDRLGRRRLLARRRRHAPLRRPRGVAAANARRTGGRQAVVHAAGPQAARLVGAREDEPRAERLAADQAPGPARRPAQGHPTRGRVRPIGSDHRRPEGGTAAPIRTGAPSGPRRPSRPGRSR